ncbi:hypothetical protein EC950183_4794, partial [Escherichia coli 95.0183]
MALIIRSVFSFLPCMEKRGGV